MSAVAVVGLGAMGRAIARNLLAAGHDVMVWNRSPEPVEGLVRAGALAAASPAAAFQSGVVFSVLSNDAAVTDVLLDADALMTAPHGAVHVNLATVSTDLARRAAALHAEYGVGYIAAPVFGRVPVAEAGKLNILAAGPKSLIDQVQPFFDVIGSRTWHLGDAPEQANIVKILGNYLIACALQSMGEAVGLAEATGVDPDRLVELLTSTLFPGVVYSSYGPLIATRTYQPAGLTTQMGRKDLHLALDAAAAENQSLPFGEVLKRVFDRAISAGHADDDWAAIAEQRPRTAG